MAGVLGVDTPPRYSGAASREFLFHGRPADRKGGGSAWTCRDSERLARRGETGAGAGRGRASDLRDRRWNREFHSAIIAFHRRQIRGGDHLAGRRRRLLLVCSATHAEAAAIRSRLAA